MSVVCTLAPPPPQPHPTRTDGGRGERALLVLLVCKHEQHRVLQILLLQHRGQLRFGGFQAVRVGRVHHKHDRVRVGVVAPPVRPDGGLPAQVPHLQLDVFKLHRLHVKPNRGLGGGGVGWVGRWRVCERARVCNRCLRGLGSDEQRRPGRRARDTQTRLPAPQRTTVVTGSSTCNRKRMVVLPALSNPRINTRTSFVPNSLPNRELKSMPCGRGEGGGGGSATVDRFAAAVHWAAAGDGLAGSGRRES